MKKLKRKTLAVLLSALTMTSLMVPALAEEGGTISSSAVIGQEAGAGPVEEARLIAIRESVGGRVMFWGESETLRQKAFVGTDTVLLCVMPDSGYRTDTVRIVYADGREETAQRREESTETVEFWEVAASGENAAVEAVFVNSGEAESSTDFDSATDEEDENVSEWYTYEDTRGGQTAETGSGGTGVNRDEADSAAGLNAEAGNSGEGDAADGGITDSGGVTGDVSDPTDDAATANSQDKTSGKEEDREKKEEKDKDTAEAAEPAASTRLLVKTDTPELLDADTVIGVIDDVYLLQFPTRQEAGDALSAYEKEVEFASEDITLRAASYGEFPVSGGEAERIMTEADNPFVEAEAEGTVSAAPASCLIALVDTGVSAGQPVAGRYSVLGDDGCDRNGHGDAMLQTILGFDSDAQVVSIKALDDTGIGTVSSLYAAIRMAIDMHASVINLSLSARSTEENEAVSSIIREAAAAGIIVVGAAGNNGQDAASYIPANVPGTLTAGACNNAGERLPSSNYGGSVDLFILAGSSSYAAATLSGIISAVGGVPSPDGVAVFAPSAATASSDYVDGLCYDGMSGNFSTAGVSYTVHNAGGKRLTDLIPGLTYDSLQAWLGSHENDNYYLDTPYPEHILNGVPQAILGRSGSCDNRNPNGDCGEIHGNDDYAGVPMMNCTGFVWHALWKASGMSYTDGINRIPAWGGIGAGRWRDFIQNNGLEYMTVKSGGTGEINDMLNTAMLSANGPDGRRFLEKGDIIWFWVDQIPLGSDDLPANGYYGDLSDKAHVGIYWPATRGNDNRWWDSIGICEYQGENGYYFRNMLHAFSPKTGSVAMTIIKLGYSEPPHTKINVQKISANAAMTDGNSCYSFAGARYAVYASREDAEAKKNALTTFVTDADGYGESEEVLDVDVTCYVRESEPPSNGSYLLDPEVYAVETTDVEKVTAESALKVSEIPAHDPLTIAVEKLSADGIPAKEALSLAGTQFTVRFYKGEYAAPQELPASDRTWVLEVKKQADGTYRAYLQSSCKVSGDEFFVLPGKTDPVLPLGTVTIEETRAADGYLRENVFTNGGVRGTGICMVHSRKNGEAVQLFYQDSVIQESGFAFSDTPAKGGVQVQKTDRELGRAEALGAGTLGGITYQICNASPYAVKNRKGETVKTGGVMQEITTDKNGIAKTGETDLPYGTYILHEQASDARKLSANDSYLTMGAADKTFQIRENGKLVTADKDGKPLVFANQIRRNDLAFRKAEDGSDRAMGRIPFVVENTKTGEKHVIVTDGNGLYSSTKYAHSRNTNANDVLLNTYTEETVLSEADLVRKTGTWFGMGQAGNMAEVRDDLPAFPYGTYTITELRCTANEGYALITDYPLVIEEDKSETGGGSVNLNTLHNIGIRPEIRTTARGEGTGGHILPATEETGIIDTVTARNLQTGKKYVLVATLMDEETENAVRVPDEEDSRIKVTGEKAFTATAGSMEVEVPISLDARRLAGRTVVVYEQLCLVGDDGSRTPVAEHRDITDKAQTLTIPEIRTTFTDTESNAHFGTPAREQKVEDTVHYTGLITGKEASVTATVMTVDADGKPAELTDADGNPISQTVTFTPEKSEGTVHVAFTIDSERLAGKKAVCFEEVRYGDIPVAIHADIHDEGQTIRYPSVHTSAAVNGEKTCIAGSDTELIDTVTYEALLPGETYVLRGQLVDKESSEPIREGDRPVTAEKIFTAGTDQGTEKMRFVFDSALLAGKTVVVFEDLFLITDAGEDVKVASHADLQDTKQSVQITEPEKPEKPLTPEPVKTLTPVATLTPASTPTPAVTPKPTSTPTAAATPTPTPTPAGQTGLAAPKTGDGSHILLYVLLFGGAAAACAGLLFVRKRVKEISEKK